MQYLTCLADQKVSKFIPKKFHGIIEQVAWNKSSLLLHIQKLNTQTLQPLTKVIITKIFTKVIKIPSWKAWVRTPSGLIKSGWKCKCFRGDYFD